MTKDEVKNLLININKAYPSWKVEDPKTTLNTWYFLFSEYTAEEADKALKDYVKKDTSRYAPIAPQLVQIIENNKKKSKIDWDALAKELMD